MSYVCFGGRLSTLGGFWGFRHVIDRTELFLKLAKLVSWTPYLYRLSKMKKKVRILRLWQERWELEMIGPNGDSILEARLTKSTKD